jgi:hypothetical protein
MTTGVSVRALASPGFALALVVLVLNDHVLKTAYPGWITGKLSDVAGLVLAPHPPPPLPGETESLPPEPTCDEPVTVPVTPNPQNGPPTTYVRCS